MNVSPVFVAVFLRTWLKVVRRPVVLLLSFVQPLIWMSFFGFLFQRFPLGRWHPHMSYLDFLLPGVCGMTVLLGASQSGIGLIRDLQTGFLDRMLATQANRVELLLGKVTADVSRQLVQAVVVVFLGVLLGVRFHLSPALLLAALYLVLFGAGYCCLSCWIALATRSQESMSAFVHVANMPVSFTSTALVLVKQMPAWLESIAVWNPLTLAVETLRNAMFFGELHWSIVSLGLLTFLVVALFGLAARALERGA